jgi:hypothetical protein
MARYLSGKAASPLPPIATHCHPLPPIATCAVSLLLPPVRSVCVPVASCCSFPVARGTVCVPVAVSPPVVASPLLVAPCVSPLLGPRCLVAFPLLGCSPLLVLLLPCRTFFSFLCWPRRDVVPTSGNPSQIFFRSEYHPNTECQFWLLRRPRSEFSIHCSRRDASDAFRGGVSLYSLCLCVFRFF